MKSTLVLNLVLTLVFLANLCGCHGKPNEVLGGDSTPVVQLDKKSTMHDIVGSWNGIGSKSIVDGKNTFSNCEKVSITIKALSASHFTIKDQFTCDRGVHIFTTGIAQFDVADQVVSISGQPVGSISSGNINIHFLKGTTDLQWNLNVNQNRLNYEFNSQTSGNYTTVSAELVQ